MVLNPYFFLERDEKWRIPNLELTLKIPKGKYVHLENETGEILKNTRNVDHNPTRKMGGKKWLMTEEELKQPKD